MQQPRFTFITTCAPDAAGDAPLGKVVWMLVSGNNRPLGRGATSCATYADARTAVQLVRARAHEAVRVVAPNESTGQWSWSLQVGGVPVAVSGRTYLRLRECHYNLDRFLDAVTLAHVGEGTRMSRNEPSAVRDGGASRVVRR
jgi:hypothetical protein